MTAAALLAGEIGRVVSAGLSKGEARRARLVFEDTLGCLLSGLSDPQVAAFAAQLSEGAHREPVTQRSHPPGDLAMLFGFAAAADELDEGHYAAGGHPAAPVVAALLAENARLGRPAEQMLLAFVAGYEAGGRLGCALALRADVHPHGTWGCVGAAVAVAVLRGTPPAGWPAVIDLAASLATATSFDTPLLGGSVRSAWIGVSARNGLLACDLAAAGVTAGAEAAERILGGVLGCGLDPEGLTRAQGAPLLHMANFMKREASCRETQGALAALDAACAGQDIAVSTIAGIDVSIFEDAARLSRNTPENATAARFSIPSVFAARLIQGAIRPDSFSEGLLASEDFRRLCGLIRIRPRAAGAEEDRSCSVVLTLADGTRLEGRAGSCPGDPADPFDEGFLKRKFAPDIRQAIARAGFGAPE